MSKEFKFRAWDKEANTMVYSDKHNKKDYQVEYDFTFNENGQVVCWWNEDYDDSFGYSKSNNGYLDNVMQYTGLKDVNGKDIYVGDIVKCIELRNDKINEWISAVEYDDCDYIVHESEMCDWPLSLFFEGQDKTPLTEIEVIGNIYKNKELLKAR